MKIHRFRDRNLNQLVEAEACDLDKSQNEKKSHFEIIFATIIQTNEEIKEKKDMEKIILCDVQIEIYPDLEKALLNLLHNSGYPNIKFDKKVDFEKLYNNRQN